jgi:uncharacterized membrane protein YjjP (DUF1212 family)
MLLTLSRLFDKILDMPRYKRMPLMFMFTGMGGAVIYFVIAGALLIWTSSLDFILGGALGCGIGTGLINMIMIELRTT